MTQWCVTKRAVVFPWHGDLSGEMNPRFFFDHFDDSSFLVWNEIGCPYEYLGEFGVITVIARYTVEIHSRLAVGASFVISAGPTRMGEKSVCMTHHLHDAISGEPCATMEAVHVLFDLESRSAAAMPDPVRERLSGALMIEEKPPSTKDSLPILRSVEEDWSAERRGLDTYRSLVHTWHCDHLGHMNARWYGHHADDARRQLYAMKGLDLVRLEQQGLSFATRSLRIDYKRELRAGDPFVIRSQVSQVGDTNVHCLHRLHHVVTNEIHAEMEGLDVLSSVGAGPDAEIPAEIRNSLIGHR